MIKTSFLSAFRLSLFAAAVLFTVTIVHLLAKKQISAQQSAALLAQFHDIAPNVPLNEDFLRQKESIDIAGNAGFLYRAPNGVKFVQTSTNKGYNGEIKLLIGIAGDGKTLLGVRVLQHRETPGLGDKIEARISPWITGFSGKSLASARFAVKKDGGDFDSFTGATITPRAVVNEVGRVLQHFSEIEKAN